MRNPIFDIDNWREIGATLARNKTRTFLTAFGIFWGTAMLAMLLGGAEGLEGMLKRNFQGFSTNMAFAGSGRTSMSYKGFNKGMSWDITDRDIEDIIRITPHIDALSRMTQAGVTVVAGSQSKSCSAMGVEADFSKIQIPVLYSGRFINSSDVKQSLKVAVLGKNVAGELFGSASPVGKSVNINGIYFTVIGVAGQKGEASIGGRMDDSVVLPFTTLRRAFYPGTNVGYFVFNAAQGYTPTQLKPYIDRVFKANHPINPKDDNYMWFGDVSERFKMVDNLFLGVSILAFFVGFGTLLAGIIGVGNIMWIIVKERTQEIGIRRAIGAKPRDIIVQILSEGMVLTAVAGTAGVSFATIVLFLVNKATTDPVLGSAHFELSFTTAVGIMLVFLVLGTAAGLIPSVKAMRIKPVEAINEK